MATDFLTASKQPRRKRLDISATFTDEAMAAIGAAHELADRGGYKMVEPEHLFAALLTFNRAANIFIRLGLPTSVVAEALTPILTARLGKNPAPMHEMPLLSSDFQETLFRAYEEAYLARQDYVGLVELLVASIGQSPASQELLFDLNIDQTKLANVAEWARVRERLYRQYVKFRRAAGRRSKSGLDRAMTAVATPFLNNFSEDLTWRAKTGQLDTTVSRDKEIDEIFRAVEGGGENVILVGEAGVGKRSVIEGLAERMIAEDVPKRLKDKRLVRLSASSLLSGATSSEAIERLIIAMREAARAGNVILFIHHIHELVGVSTGGGGSSALDLADALSEELKRGRVLLLATTTPEFYARLISGSALGGLFAKVDIKEMDANQAIRVLESKVGLTEYKHHVFFAYEAIAKAVELAGRYLRDICLPGSALEVMHEAAAQVRGKRGGESLVTGEDVAKVVSDKTGVPVASVTADESRKLLNLEAEMKNRVVGQDEAVGLVANALRRARANVRAGNRPIANFLFLGPTGVGKTELAKTMAAVYFGGEERMIRLDMSEYQDRTSAYRLIGEPGHRGTGILTEAVRRQPFSLLLLDEIEKADKDVLNLFLQVMEDGRLTDSSGRTVSFDDIILIATSNAGTAYVQEQLQAGLSSEAIRERLIRGEMKQYFRPEFLNRFDGIVLFKSLSFENVKKIAGLMLKRLVKELEEKGIELLIKDEALDFLAGVGFDPEFGARPLRRAIQERVENKLAELLLSGALKRRDKITLGKGGEISTS